MRPAQFGTQCVHIWEGQIELPHIPQIAEIKPFPELGGHLFGNILEHLLAISGPVIFTAGFKDRLADLPVGSHHGGVDRRIDLPLRLDQIAPDGAAGVLRLRGIRRGFSFHQFIHKSHPFLALLYSIYVAKSIQGFTPKVHADADIRGHASHIHNFFLLLLTVYAICTKIAIVCTNILRTISDLILTFFRNVIAC